MRPTTISHAGPVTAATAITMKIAATPLSTAMKNARSNLRTPHAEFVAQHEDLELLAIGRAAEQDQELEDLAKSEVQKREHGITSGRLAKTREASRSATGGEVSTAHWTPIGFMRPTGGHRDRANTETGTTAHGRTDPASAGASAETTGCPRTRGGRSARGVAISLGHGPAYPVLGMAVAPPAPRGFASLTDDLYRKGVYFHKTLWAISRRARSDVLIRASSYRGSRPVNFFDSHGQHRTLRLPRPNDAWGYATTTTLLPGPGCYAFHVTGRSLDQHIIFRAELG